MIANDSLLIFVLGFLSLAVAFNLWLSFRLVSALRRLPMPAATPPPELEVGTLITDLTLESFTGDGKAQLYEPEQYAKVLVFLTSRCNKCKSKLPELRESLEKAKDMGVLIRILSLESSKRMKSFLEEDALLRVTMRVSKAAYDYLNPQGASPYYLFIDADNTLQAAGFIGDENWINFTTQLKEEA